MATSKKNTIKVSPGNVLIKMQYPLGYALKKHLVNGKYYEVSAREGDDLVNVRKIAVYK